MIYSSDHFICAKTLQKSYLILIENVLTTSLAQNWCEQLIYQTSNWLNSMVLMKEGYGKVKQWGRKDVHCRHKKLDQKRWSHLTLRQPERLGEDLYLFYFSYKLASTHLKIYPRLYLRISDTSIYTLKYCVYILLF